MWEENLVAKSMQELLHHSIPQVDAVIGLDAQEAGGSRVHMEGAQVSKI